MIVHTKDVKALIEAVMQKAGTEGLEMSKKHSNDYFIALIGKINEQSKGFNLKPSSFYKHYYTKINTHKEDKIGYSVKYLNALARYAHDTDYIKFYSAVSVEESHEVPIFPPDAPCFPATPAIRINHTYFKNLWIKDESHNPTGLCVDRKAEALAKLYKDTIVEHLTQNQKLPRLSMISSGRTAISIQYRFLKLGLPALKVLVDNSISNELELLLKKVGAEVYKADLKKINIEDSNALLELTKNLDGIDLNKGGDTFYNYRTFKYYDWLAYEVLSLNPSKIIFPYGRGELYRNIMEVLEYEIGLAQINKNTRRFLGVPQALKDIQFIGVAFDDTDTNLIDCNLPEGAAHIGHIVKVSKKANQDVIAEAKKIAKSNNVLTYDNGILGLAYLLSHEPDRIHKQTKKDKHHSHQDHITFNPDEKIVIINTGTYKDEVFENL